MTEYFHPNYPLPPRYRVFGNEENELYWQGERLIRKARYGRRRSSTAWRAYRETWRAWMRQVDERRRNPPPPPPSLKERVLNGATLVGFALLIPAAVVALPGVAVIAAVVHFTEKK